MSTWWWADFKIIALLHQLYGYTEIPILDFCFHRYKLMCHRSITSLFLPSADVTTESWLHTSGMSSIPATQPLANRSSIEFVTKTGSCLAEVLLQNCAGVGGRLMEDFKIVTQFYSFWCFHRCLNQNTFQHNLYHNLSFCWANTYTVKTDFFHAWYSAHWQLHSGLYATKFPLHCKI